MFFEEKQDGVLLRVRLTPNSSSCYIGGTATAADGSEYLKVNVVSVPEKGKANRELIKFLSKEMKEAKSAFEIISGETDRWKKIIIRGESSELAEKIRKLKKDEGINDGKNS